MRHGERLTYNRGCRCQDCRDAAARYERGRQWDILQGRPRHLPILGTRRRLQALCALGWSFAEQARRLGVSNELVLQWAKVRKRVTPETAARIAALYDELSMVLPPEETNAQRSGVAKTRAYARRNGWATPLMWDDAALDDPSARPYRVRHDSNHKPLTEVDEAVVLRVLAGENLPCTKAEKDEVMRRWVASGKPANAMVQRMGWNDSRYGKGAA